MKQIHFYFEVVLFGIIFLEKLMKASQLKNLGKNRRNIEPLHFHV